MASDDNKTIAQEFSRLRHLIPLRRLTDEEFCALMGSASVERIEAGKILFRAGIDDSSMFYLLEGTAEISDDAGGCFSLVGGSIETAHPLSAHPRARKLAIATTPLVFVRLPLELLQIGQSEQPQPGIEIEELAEDDNSIDKRIIFDVYHALMDGSFSLPTLPDVALRIRTAAADPDNGVEDVTRIVHADPAIAAYCVRMANNAAFSGVNRVSEVREAVVRMGVAATADMITAYTLKELYTAPDAVTDLQMQAAWRHSARIAALSFVIARGTGKLNAEQALLGGLLHDIGMLIIIREWHRHSEPPLKSHVLHALGSELSGSLGSMVLRNWHLPDNLVTAALEAEDWSSNRNQSLDVCDCITLAHAHDTVPPPWSLKVPELEQIAACSKIEEHETSDGQRLAIVTSAEAELGSLDALLKG